VRPGQPLAIVGNEFYNAVEKDAANSANKRKALPSQDGPVLTSRLLDFEVIASRYVLLGSAMHDLGGQADRWSSEFPPGMELSRRNKTSVQVKLRRWLKMHLQFLVPLKKVSRPPGQAAGCFYSDKPFEGSLPASPLRQRWSSRLLEFATTDSARDAVEVKLGTCLVRRGAIVFGSMFD